MNDRIQPKTELLPPKSEQSDDESAMPVTSDEILYQPKTEFLPPKSEQSDDESAMPVTSDEILYQPITSNIEQTSSSDFNMINGFSQKEVTNNNDGSWEAHVASPLILNTEIIVHRSQNDCENSTSVDTLIDSDLEIKPLTEEDKKLNENTNPEFDYIFCIAAISKTTPNSSKLLAISKIDANIKMDLKSDGSSINGYIADHSSSSTNSTTFHLEEPFVIPKIPRDSFTSLSSSGSSNGIFLQQTKLKSKNVLLSKNVNIYPENLVCQKCSHIYPKISDNFSLDSKDFISEPKSKKSKHKKKLKQLSTTKKTVKKTTESENLIIPKTDIKLEEDLQNQNNDVANILIENEISNPISFNIGNKVLAYWVADKLFYPAIIIDVVSSKYKVEFMSDYVIKSVNADGLVHSAALKIGSPIGIFDTISQEYRVGEIVSINDVPNEVTTYTIDLESEEVIVPFENLALEVDKARMLQDKIVPKNYQRLSMSNVSEGKRIRSSRSINKKCNNVTTKKNVSSKRKKIDQETSEPIKKRKCLFPQDPDPRDIPSTSTGITEENFEMSFQFISSDSDFDHIREDLTTVNMGHLKSSDIDSEHSSPDNITRVIKSPIDKFKKVFTGLNFVLSYAKYKRIPMASDSDISITENDTNLALNKEFFKPDKLYKKYLETLISKHGGTCFRYLNLIPKSRFKFSYIITDTPSQTCNFFLGLSLGIPAYHHKYIEQAVSEKIPFSEFLIRNKVKPIPNGWAVEKKSLVFRSPETEHIKIFSDYIIYLALLEKPKNEFFAGILRFCGAIVYTTWKNGVCMPLTRHIVVIVTDEDCPPILANANVPKLSIVWVIQSLICESPRPINGHESYIAITDVD